MKVILHDLDEQYNESIMVKCDELIHATGKYAPCQGCFGCWTKQPAECFMKDSLNKVCRIRSIGISTPFSTYRGKQMHHTLRYGKHKLLRVIVYGEITDREKETFTYLTKRNAINYGFVNSEALFLNDLSELEEVI